MLFLLFATFYFVVRLCVFIRVRVFSRGFASQTSASTKRFAKPGKT